MAVVAAAVVVAAVVATAVLVEVDDNTCLLAHFGFVFFLYYNFLFRVSFRHRHK